MRRTCGVSIFGGMPPIVRRKFGPKPTKKPAEPALPGIPSLEEIEAELARRSLPAAFPLGSARVRDEGIPGVAGLVGSRLEGPPLHDDMRFAFATGTWDAWMVLHHLASQALVRNRDGSFPARWLKPLEARLVPLPSWLHVSQQTERRILTALRLLDDLSLLVTRRQDVETAANLGVGPEGTLQLKEGRAAFFARVLVWKALGTLDPERDLLAPMALERIGYSRWTLRLEEDATTGVGAHLARRVLEVIPPTGAKPIREIDRAFAPAAPHVPDRSAPWDQRHLVTTADDYFDRISATEATRFLTEAVAPANLVGLVCFGINLEGQVTWSLTPDGRRWLGLAPDASPQPANHARVTPAFDVFFGRIDPAVLAEVSLFAAPTGQEMGIVARITRASVQGAMSIGIEVSEIVSTLEARVAGALPANVRTTLDDWSRGAQPVRVREGVVLQCPDAAVAESLERLAKGAAERLGETALFLPDRKALATLRRKATESGIFL